MSGYNTFFCGAYIKFSNDPVCGCMMTKSIEPEIGYIPSTYVNFKTLGVILFSVECTPDFQNAPAMGVWVVLKVHSDHNHKLRD